MKMDPRMNDELAFRLHLADHVFNGPRWLTAPTGYKLVHTPVEISYSLCPNGLVTAAAKVEGSVLASGNTGIEAHAALVETLIERDKKLAFPVFVKQPPSLPVEVESYKSKYIKQLLQLRRQVDRLIDAVGNNDDALILFGATPGSDIIDAITEWAKRWRVIPR